MQNRSLGDLMKTFMFGKVTPSGFQELKEKTMLASDTDLDDVIKTIWDDTDKVIPMNIEVKTAVQANLRRQIQIIPKRTYSYWLKISAVILLPVLISLGSYLYFSKQYIFTPEEFLVMAENGQKTKILLPDGTQVWLNSESQLSYTSDFNQNNRTVKLEGEAFFDVNKSTDHSFTVQTGHVNIEVYGTAFNVTAYKEEPTVDVSLLRGKLGIKNSDENTLLTDLSPNQQVSISKNDMKWSKQDCDAQLESLWTQNKLKFENTPATDMFRKLERWYGMTIHVENLNPDIRYGFTLKSESLREILDEINKITPITYNINGEEVYVIIK